MIAVLVIVVLALGTFWIKNSLQAQQQFPYQWPPFTMTYSIGGENATASKRLEWYGTNHWVSEVLNNDTSKSGSKVPPLNYTGARHEFKDGTYSSYDPNTGETTSRKIDSGWVMSPNKWLVPGSRESLELAGFQQSGKTSEGNSIFSLSQNRRCATDEDDTSPIPGCSTDQVVLEEFVFDPNGIPLSRVLKIDGRVIESFEVRELVIK